MIARLVVVSQYGKPEVDLLVRGGAVEADELRSGRFEVDLKPLDFAEPAVGSSLVDPVGEVGGDLGEAVVLGWVDAQHAVAAWPAGEPGSLVTRVRSFQASATSGLRCSESIPGWCCSRSRQKLPARWPTSPRNEP